MIDSAEELLLLDPSAVLGAEGHRWLAEIPHEERGQFVVSRTFFDQVAGRAEYSEADHEIWGALPEGTDRAELEELLAGLTMFSEEDVRGDLPGEVLEVANRLREMGSLVAVDEWLYLQTSSWLAGRTHKILDHFRRAGSRLLVVAGNALDDVTWLALGKHHHAPHALTTDQRLRAGLNVVIVGGIATVGALVPWLGVPGAIVGYLIQPVLTGG